MFCAECYMLNGEFREATFMQNGRSWCLEHWQQMFLPIFTKVMVFKEVKGDE